jgi:16S rRNA (uracil1498-N3)-methyltransferase
VAHVPHLYLPGPWSGDRVSPSTEQVRHLSTVLRVRDGEPCTYTDGTGTIGEGIFETGSVLRRAERSVPPLPVVDLAVSPPANKDRLRFLVEKASELGARRVIWLSSRFGQGRPPRADKAQQWAVGALEQCRGAHLTQVDDRMTAISELTGNLLVADQGGESSALPPPLTLLVGPEGGWAPGELASELPRFGLGPRVLRIETAATVGLFALLGGG